MPLSAAAIDTVLTMLCILALGGGVAYVLAKVSLAGDLEE